MAITHNLESVEGRVECAKQAQRTDEALRTYGCRLVAHDVRPCGQRLCRLDERRAEANQRLFQPQRGPAHRCAPLGPVGLSESVRTVARFCKVDEGRDAYCYSSCPNLRRTGMAFVKTTGVTQGAQSIRGQLGGCFWDRPGAVGNGALGLMG